MSRLCHEGTVLWCVAALPNTIALSPLLKHVGLVTYRSPQEWATLSLPRGISLGEVEGLGGEIAEKGSGG